MEEDKQVVMFDFRDDFGRIVFSSENLEEVRAKAKEYKNNNNLTALKINRDGVGFYCWT